MEDEHIIMGERDAWGKKIPFGLSISDRRHHVYMAGQTGTGKTTLLRNMFLQDVLAGRGAALIDPHGDNAEDLLHYIPSWRLRDVVYFNPSDNEYPIAFNLLRPTENPHLVASGLVSALKSIWHDSWGPRLEYILYGIVAALLECENVSLLGVQRMLSDSRYRAWVLKQVEDPIIRVFLIDEFERYNRDFLQESVAPIQNKVGKLLMSPNIRNILGQVKSKIDARFMMDNRRIFIANLSKGLLGEDKANLMGAMLVAEFKIAAMSRANVPEHERKDFSLFVDEFTSFASDSFASILSEARKYRLCLTLSHQYVGQMEPQIRDAVFGNVGSIITFRLGHRDATMLESEFGNEITASSFTRLGRHEVYAKLLNDGEHHDPFLGKTLPPFGRRFGRADKIIKASREKYATRRGVVEEKVRRWLNS